MVRQKDRPLNRLEKELPEGILVDAAWLRGHGYSRQLLNHYVNAGWLMQPARGVYRRPRGSSTWQQLIVSLQTYMKSPLVIGGRTALELLGYAHYLPRKEQAVHLYGPKPPPGWFHLNLPGERLGPQTSAPIDPGPPAADAPGPHTKIVALICRHELTILVRSDPRKSRGTSIVENRNDAHEIE